MTRTTVPFRQADVARAVRAVRQANVAVSGVEIAPDGTIRVLTGTLAAEPSTSPFDTWKQKHNASTN